MTDGTPPTDRAAGPASPRSHRRRVLLAAAGAATAAATAGSLVLFFGRQRPIELSMAVRALEPRVSWPPAAAHRPYDPTRSGATVPATVLARLAELRDEHALGDAYLIAGDLAQAQAHLSRAPRSPALDTDQSAAALLQHDPETALEHADAALRARAGMAAAEWNRALALRDLDLVRVAAETFDHVASRDEPGWADEARTRARALHRIADGRLASYRAASVAATALESSGKLPPDPQVRAYPELFRAALVAAIKDARAPAQRERLQPLAHTLDALAGSDALAALLSPARTQAPADSLFASLDRELRAAEALAARRDDDAADRLLTATAARAEAARLDAMAAEADLLRATLPTPGAGVPPLEAEAAAHRAAQLFAVAAPPREVAALRLLERLARARGGAELADACAREAALAMTP